MRCPQAGKLLPCQGNPRETLLKDPLSACSCFALPQSQPLALSQIGVYILLIVLYSIIVFVCSVQSDWHTAEAFTGSFGARGIYYSIVLAPSSLLFLVRHFTGIYIHMSKTKLLVHKLSFMVYSPMSK